MRHILLVFLVLLFCSSCKQPKKSIVFTDPIFTDGIEGPAANSKGDLFMVNVYYLSTIGKLTYGNRNADVFLMDIEGALFNGIRFLNDSMFYAADYNLHRIFKINGNNAKYSIYAGDTSMNQPNDLAIMKNGILFASDPNWEDSTGQLWRIDIGGKCILLEKNMGTTNGVEVSPNDEYLYVNESIQRKIWKYKIDKQGNISDKKLFYSFDDAGLDGMRCDIEGNLYVARYDKGTVAIISPSGELIEEVYLSGQKPTNVTFGGKDFKTVYVTMQDKKWIEIFKADFRGREPFNY